MYNCPNCSTPLQPGTRFCPRCGYNMGNTYTANPVCPVCHRSYPVGTTFCSFDGAKLVAPNNVNYRNASQSFQNSYGQVPGTLSMDYHKASLGSRFLAYILDALITLGLGIPAIIFFAIGMSKVSYSYYGSSSSCGVFFFLAFIFWLLPLIYVFIKDGLGEGQSYGKKLMGIKVIKLSDMSNCTMGTSAIRAIIYYLLSFIPLVGWLVEPIMVLATSDGRRLADKAAGTMVVEARK